VGPRASAGAPPGGRAEAVTLQPGGHRLVIRHGVRFRGNRWCRIAQLALTPSQAMLATMEKDSLGRALASPSPADVAQQIERALTGFSPFRHVVVSVNNVCIQLRGRVASYYLKQMAQEAVMAMTRIPLVNDLEVAVEARAETVCAD